MAENARGTRGWLIGLMIVAVVAVAVLYGRMSSRTAVEIRTAQVGHADIVSTESTNGKVEPVEDFQARAPMSTVVAKVYTQLNERVGGGAVLLRLDDSDARRGVAAAQAALVSAQAGLGNVQHGGTADETLSAANDMTAARSAQTQAAATLASTQALATRGSASANEVASARQRKDDADARVAQLSARRTERYSSSDIAVQQAQVAQARASLSAAQTVLDSVDVHAPFAGTVYSLPVSDHDYVAAGEPLLNMADLSHIQVRAYFDEPEIGKLADGQSVKIVWDAKPNQAWHGHVKQVPTTIISYQGTRNVGECVITVDDAHGDLLPNTNVTITVTTSQKKGVLSVPREALHTDPKNDYVLMVVNGRLQRKNVQVGSGVNLTRVEIASGLNDGDTIALSGNGGGELKDGMIVKVGP